MADSPDRHATTNLPTYLGKGGKRKEKSQVGSYHHGELVVGETRLVW